MKLTRISDIICQVLTGSAQALLLPNEQTRVLADTSKPWDPKYMQVYK